MHPLTSTPVLLALLGLLGLLILLSLISRTPLPPGRCPVCGRRVEPGECYCPRHESDL